MAATSTRLVEVANGVYACLQADGSWGLSNAGLIVGHEDRLLVDTFFDLPRTRSLLEQLRRASEFDPVATVVVNTHTNGDHCYGNALLPDRRIIASSRAARELLEMPAAKLDKLMMAARAMVGLGRGRRVLRTLLQTLHVPLGVDLVDAAPYVVSAFRDFEFRGIPLAPPNETFTGSLELNLGQRRIALLELGPAHTQGDIVAFDAETRTLFAGDLLFMGCHPLAWAGTPEGCIAALTRLLELDPVAVVPGHGPVTDRAGIEDHVAYFRALREECRPLFAEGVTTEVAAQRLMAKGFGARAQPERLFVNVEAAYREFSPERKPLHVLRAMGAMSRLTGMA